MVLLDVWLLQRLTFHGDGEGVRGRAVVVGGLTLVLSVVFQGDAVEVEPAAVVFLSGACIRQAAVFLLPFHLWSRSSDTREEKENQEEGETLKGRTDLARID